MPPMQLLEDDKGTLLMSKESVKILGNGSSIDAFLAAIKKAYAVGYIQGASAHGPPGDLNIDVPVIDDQVAAMLLLASEAERLKLHD